MTVVISIDCSVNVHEIPVIDYIGQSHPVEVLLKVIQKFSTLLNACIVTMRVSR